MEAKRFTLNTFAVFDLEKAGHVLRSLKRYMAQKILSYTIVVQTIARVPFAAPDMISGGPQNTSKYS